ncbi:choice-of-anchor D domain-containing protein [Pontiellaceae bacterium B1224]|nr:choice-of-anchor D domain-containing protein [Pontiellaceae bacterium B1224]
MKKRIGILLAGGLTVMNPHAATIEWTTGTITGYESDVVTNGILLEAVNGVGGSVTTSPTVNGVTFTADGTLLANSWTGDPWTTPATNAAYDQLLSTIDYEGSGTDPLTLKTFVGLTVGAAYVIQIWNAESSNVRSMVYDGSGDNAVDGLSYGVGTFTADETTQALVVTASQGGPRLTAYQLRAISGHTEPDPIIDLSVTNLNFGSTYVGYTNSLTVVVENIGGEVLEGTASVSAPFYIESGAAYSLSNSQEQVVTVLFAPQSIGEVTESLVFTGGGGATISVSGTGVVEPEASIGLSVSNLAFTTTYLGATNSLTVTVQNTGGMILDGTASVAAPFHVESGGTYSLGLGEEQDVVILFAPVTEGDFSETLSFTGAGGSNITVSGTGELILGTIVADIAGDYISPSAEPEGWDYLYSDTAVGGTEVSLTPDRLVSSSYGGGNTGFGDPNGQYGVPGVLGSLTGSGQYEIFSDGYDGNASSDGNLGVPGTDLLIHPGSGESNDYVIVRYTFSEEDLAGATVVDITGSFREQVGKTNGDPADSILGEVYHNTTQLFSVSGAVGRLWQTDGVFNITNLTVAVGDTISFVVGNNGKFAGDETALTGVIVIQEIPAPVLVPGVEVVDGHIEFQLDGKIGVHYQIESTEMLNLADWQPVLDIDPLTESPMDVSIPTTNAAAFYRIRYIP